ncbi:vsp protein (plasmid) [Borrelia turicatae]|uniref:Vsp protein n=1 Tax=Borrelia turicatae TaxID=142 RepID=A0A172XDC4_BORTU|nr:Vsp/OspC family lipoprotein [Borrelia turicatae]ANF34559.1 vsp protein [Borrelia turicatae]UPA15732.1 vsp protein [Borrelia turicatae]
MKRITLSALLMTLFLLMSCNNSGTSPKDGQAAKSDGTVIDLVTITKNIKDTVAFAKDVKEVHTLVKSIDELAKAIKKKIQAGGLQDDTDNLNGTLLAGAYQIMADADSKLTALEGKSEKFAGIKDKVISAKQKSTAFLNKLKSENATLGAASAAVSSANAKEAIDRNNATKTKGAKELEELNTAIDALLTSAEDAVTAAINALSTPAKSASTAQSN